MDSPILETKLIPMTERFYSSDKNWGIYQCAIGPDEDFSSFRFSWEDQITIVGSMQQLELGKLYWAKIKETYHDKFGYQYQVIWIGFDFSSIEAQKDYLESLLPQAQFEVLWNAYKGQDIIQLLKEDRIDWKSLKGIGEKTYQEIKQRVLENVYMFDLFVELSPFSVPYSTILQLTRKFGNVESTRLALKEKPYILVDVVEGCTFPKVDAVVMQTAQLPPDSPYRLQSAIIYVLKEQAHQWGHCWISVHLLIQKTAALTKLTRSTIQRYLLSHSSTDWRIEQNRIGLQCYYKMEKDIFKKIQSLLSAKSHIRIENVEEKIKKAELEQGFSYTEEQREAIFSVAKNNVMILSGKAGTGKSTTLRAIYHLFRDNYTVAICALSGKAAQRAKETTGCDSYTIHRLLQWKPDVGFEYYELNPLPVDVLIVDEMSMVDSFIFRNLIVAVENGCKVVLVGDIQQLPPVGIASPFRDLIESKVIPEVQLTQIHRQAQNSATLMIANKVREGIPFIQRHFTGGRAFGENNDFIYIAHADMDRVLKDVVQLCKRYNENILDLQVLTPTKTKGILSTKNLNPILQDIFNPHDGMSAVYKLGETEFRVGDKVIHSGNNYETQVFNGTIGKIMHIQDNLVVIDFDGNEVTYQTKEQMRNIELCYACTIHRFQGSGSNYVILALETEARMLLSRHTEP